MIALVTLVLWKEELQLIPWLKAAISEKLTAVAIEHATLQSAADDLRRQAVSLRVREFEMDQVLHAMNQLDLAKVKSLLIEIADIFSLGSAGRSGSPISNDRIC